MAFLALTGVPEGGEGQEVIHTGGRREAVTEGGGELSLGWITGDWPEGGNALLQVEGGEETGGEETGGEIAAAAVDLPSLVINTRP